MNEQEVLVNTLLSLKHMKAFFNTFMEEASNDNVVHVVEDAYQEISALQRRCYDIMVELGYMQIHYQTKEAIKKEYQKYKNKEC